LGIEVNKGIVTVNDNHENLVDTGLSSNPHINYIDNNYKVYSVFKRKKHKRNKPFNQKGDGTPLIYALKLMHDTSIAKSEIKKLIPNFSIILNLIAKEINPELIISIPSAYGISKIVSSRLSKVSGNHTIVEGVFRKASIQEAIDNVDLRSISSKYENKLNAEIGSLLKGDNLNNNFSLKVIKNQLRPAFNPLIINDTSQIPSKIKAITLVDDLLSTGTTLLGAIKLLKSRYPNVNVSAVCLLSALKTKL